MCLEDLEKYAQKHLEKSVYDYYSCGANSEQTLQENGDAFKRIRLCPRLLVDVSERDLSTTILGDNLSFPVAISPTAMQSLAHQDGEIGTARAAASMGSGMILSSYSTKSIEDVAASSPDCLCWFQLYIFKDKELTERLVRRAERAGYKALVLTVDTPIVGIRLADLRNGFKVDSSISLPNLEDADTTNSEGDLYGKVTLSPAVSWKDISWLKTISKLPIVLKGILSGDDARRAADIGVAGIIVSNHGGRQLDGVLATIDALPEVVQAVRETDIEVYLDGGVRKGTDILKALALGARAVFIGRPAIWGLAYKVVRMQRRYHHPWSEAFHVTCRICRDILLF